MIVTKFLPMIFSMLAFSAQAEHAAPIAVLDREPCVNGCASAAGAVPAMLKGE